ncbi:MAG: O-antigen ligase family protein, partial [Parasporobacterium sp.]|nr:O-antigen ligase family protein [Parasporobacterium sp.]
MKQKDRKESIIRLSPLIVFIAVIFLLVHAHGYSMPLSQFSYLALTDTTLIYDVFSHNKMVDVLLVTAAAILIMSYGFFWKKRRIRKSLLYYPMAVYGLMILLSFICSDYKQFSLWGTYDRFEGTIVHLCYLVMVFYAINFVDDGRELEQITTALFAGVTIACLIGLTQLLGHDFFSDGIGQWLLMGGASDKQASFNFGNDTVYQTVYNTNYVGFYLCLVVPVLCDRILSMFKKEKKSGKDVAFLIWMLILMILIVVNVIGSRSIGSLPALVFSFAAVCLVHLLKEKWKIGIAALFAGYVCIGVLVLLGVFGEQYALFSEPKSERPQIDHMKTDGNTIEIMLNGNLLVAEYVEADGTLQVKDSKGRPLETFTLPEEEDRYYFEDARFNKFISFVPVIVDNRILVIFRTKGENWPFEFTQDGAKYINAAGYPESLNGPVEHAGIIKNYAFGSGRGYIWDTTFPVLKKHFLIGSGADTFMMEFPQNDYATRYSHD